MSKKRWDIWNYWQDFPLVDDIIAFLKRKAPPGFQGVSIYTIIKFAYNEAMNNDIITRANSVAFSIFLSLFPTIIFVFTLLPLFPISADYLSLLEEYTEDFFPEQAHNYLFNMVRDVVSIKRGGLLSLGFILALIFSSTGMMDLMNGFEKSYENAFKKRNYFKKRLIAILLVAAHASMMFVTLVVLVFGQPFLTKFTGILEWDSFSVFLLQLFKWLCIFGMVYFAIATIYRYGPSLKKRVAWISPGAILASSMFVFVSLLFSIVINNFGRYNEIYGSIGALIVFLLWLQINALIILIGFELNAGIAVHRVPSTRMVKAESIFEQSEEE